MVAGLMALRQESQALIAGLSKRLTASPKRAELHFLIHYSITLDDFRRQISARDKPSLDDLGGCAERYRVSLTAAALRWLQYTERRSVLVVSRDGLIKWARSSRRALKTGAFFRTANMPPVSIPAASLAARGSLSDGGKTHVPHGKGVWFSEQCEEIALASDHYDFVISLLHLGEAEPRYGFEEEKQEDVFERMTALNSRR